MRRVVAHVVSDTVDLDHQPLAGTVEIHDKIADRMVIAEFDTERSLTKVLPQQAFRQGHLAALLASRCE
jgi:hypothetical protein